jgi:acyl carrier protein
MIKSNATIEGSILEFIIEHYPLARSRKIDGNSRLLEQGIIDSLGILDLVAFLEGEFQISFGDEELTEENFQTAARLASLVCKKCQEG